MTSMKKLKAFGLRNIAWINIVSIILLVGWSILIPIQGWEDYLPCAMVARPLSVFECQQVETPNLLIYAPIFLLITITAISFSLMLKLNIIARIIVAGLTMLILNYIVVYIIFFMIAYIHIWEGPPWGDGYI